MKNFIPVLLSIGLLSSCGGGGSTPTQPDSFSQILSTDFSNAKTYIGSSPYASVLVNCIAITEGADSCSLATLPTIGQDSLNPSIDDIMDRVVVSHDWMGVRMRNLLEQMPAEILLLLRSATAIVIDDDIRPAYFWSATGAIYIDPAYLWLTNAEKSTINTKQDFRSDFGNDLQFKRRWRYVIGNEYAWQSYSLTGSEERQIEDTLIAISWLFFHELAHANDCMSVSLIGQLNNSQSFLDNYFTIRDNNQCVQDQLISSADLQSQVWKDLARVLYHGDDSTSTQRSYTPEDVGGEFVVDYAMDTYSYSTVWEDTAMSFEAVLMKKIFNAERDMAIVPYTEEFDCATSPVKYGVRGRMGDADVKLRSQLVAEAMLPEIDFTTFFANLEASEAFPFDHGWCDVNLSNITQKTSKEQQKQSKNHAENVLDIL